MHEPRKYYNLTLKWTLQWPWNLTTQRKHLPRPQRHNNIVKDSMRTSKLSHRRWNPLPRNGTLTPSQIAQKSNIAASSASEHTSPQLQNTQLVKKMRPRNSPTKTLHLNAECARLLITPPHSQNCKKTGRGGDLMVCCKRDRDRRKGNSTSADGRVHGPHNTQAVLSILWCERLVNVAAVYHDVAG